MHSPFIENSMHGSISYSIVSEVINIDLLDEQHTALVLDNYVITFLQNITGE